MCVVTDLVHPQGSLSDLMVVRDTTQTDAAGNGDVPTSRLPIEGPHGEAVQMDRLRPTHRLHQSKHPQLDTPSSRQQPRALV